MSAVLVQPTARAPPHEAVYVDLFCGAGGSTTGAMSVLREMFPREGSVRTIVVNHDPQAIATHALNHPDAEHHDCDIEKLDPDTVLSGEEVTVLWASAPCTHFSKARGGQPRSEQKRATPDYIIDWIRKGRPQVYIEENVWDITSWGPLDEHGKPIKKLKGTLFRKHLAEIEALGYRAEYRKLNAADFGDPTTRERFILIAVRDGGPVPWPEPTHSKDGTGGKQRWVGADKILDREQRGKSMFGRVTKDGRPMPVAAKSRRRIARGFRAKGPEWRNVAPAIEENRGPIPLVDALNGLSVEEAERLLTALLGEDVEFTFGQCGGSIPRPSELPIATVPTGGALRRIDARLIVTLDRPETNRSLAKEPSQPVPAVTTNERLVQVDARIIVGRGGPAWQAEPRDVKRPLGSLTTDPHLAVADARVLMHTTHGGRVHDVTKPVPTVTTANRGEMQVAEPVVLAPNFGEREGQPARFHDVAQPLPAVTSHGAGQLARAVLSAYYGTGTHQEITLPLRTVTTKDRHSLAEAVVRIEDLVIDILLRMLTVRELAKAMSFPDWYVFLGTKGAQVRQIGNAVAVRMSAAIVRAVFQRVGASQARLSDFGGAAA